MKGRHPLSEVFVQRYPVESARVLEKIPPEHVAPLLNTLPDNLISSVMQAMLPFFSAACLKFMSELDSARLLSLIPVTTAVRIYRLLPLSMQQELMVLLPEKNKHLLNKYLQYKSGSVGEIFDSEVEILAQNITVEDALDLIEQTGQSKDCEIYVVDDLHRLVGLTGPGKLLVAKRHLKLHEVMNTRVQPISVRASVEAIAVHPGWLTRRSLPVVERDNTLLGNLHYSQLQQALGKSLGHVQRDPLDGLLSLTSLYWLSLMQLLNSIMGLSRTEKGERK